MTSLREAEAQVSHGKRGVRVSRVDGCIGVWHVHSSMLYGHVWVVRWGLYVCTGRWGQGVIRKENLPRGKVRTPD